MREKPIFGYHTRKVQPRLRMIANGSSRVNGIRAQNNSSIKLLDSHAAFVRKGTSSYKQSKTRKPKKGRISAPPDDVSTSVFVHFSHADSAQQLADDICGKAEHATVMTSRERISTASVPLSEVKDLAEQEGICYVEQGESLKVPTPIINAESRAPFKKLRRFDTTGGDSVLVGIIDVGGFAFDHEDFLDEDGGTRFVRIWDQGGNSRPAPIIRDGNNTASMYGSEIKQEHLNTAIDQSSNFGLPAHRLEPQSQMSASSHATHVASIAAGNRGVCRNSRIAGVLIDIPAEDNDRRRSFYDSTQLVHAVEYIKSVANEIKAAEGLTHLPISINISLGTNGNAHDGSSALCRWIDSLLTEPGISISVAAGNSGQERALDPDDFGFVMGRIHSSGFLAAQGLDVDMEWQVVGNTISDVSENELEVWYSAADRFSISVQPPGEAWLPIVEPGDFLENHQLPNGAFISIYNELYHPINGANYISVYLSPFISDTAVVGIKPGVWKVRVHGTEVRDGNFDAWIERDDPFRFEPIGPIQPWRFPSFFSERSNVDNSSVSSLACAQNILSVANLDELNNQINISSSQGPTRDGRHKPEIAAPGTDIVAANGFVTDPDQQWISMTGTSMASPYVAGIAGLMLHHNHNLTAPQIRGVLQRTAKPLPGTDYAWKNDAGYGVIDADKAIDEVDRVYQRRDIQ